MAIELTANTIIEELDRRIRSRMTITAINTHEEQRFLTVLRAIRDLPIQNTRGHKPIYVWSRAQGLRITDKNGDVGQSVGGEGTDDPFFALETIAHSLPEMRGLVALCDFAPWLARNGQEDPVMVRRLRELAWELRETLISVFIVGHDFPSIPTLEKEVHVYDLGLPHDLEVAAILDGRVEEIKQATKDHPTGKVKLDIDPETHEKLVSAMSGLTIDEAEHALAYASIKLNGLDGRAVPVVLEQKKEAIRRSGSLTYVPPEPLENFGGYKALIDLAAAAAQTFTPEAAHFGIEPHRGFLLIGPPGCGKDYLKKVISGIVNRSLLDLDMAMVMGEGGGVIGQSAVTINRALQLAEALKPVLGISEFEKGVGGLQSSSRSDAGETSRMIGKLLNWMAEQQSCMIVATANDVRQLAPEQIREGRFGAKVWVGLPSIEDRQAIFRVHLKKRGKNPETFHLERAAEMAKQFSGAEIEQAVKNALLHAWVDDRGKREVNDCDLEKGISNITPTGRVNAQEIKDLETWAEQVLGAVSATDKDALIRQSASKMTRSGLELES